MMDALGVLVSAAPEATSQARGAKNGKDTDKAGNSGFSDELKGVREKDHHGRQATDEKSAKGAGTAGDEASANAENASGKSGRVAAGLSAFSSLKANLEQAAAAMLPQGDVATATTDATLTVVPQDVVDEGDETAPVSGKSKATSKTMKSVKTGAVVQSGHKGADFSQAGASADADAGTVTAANVKSAVQKVLSGKSSEADATDTTADAMKVDTDAAPASTDTSLNDVLGLLAAGGKPDNGVAQTDRKSSTGRVSDVDSASKAKTGSRDTVADADASGDSGADSEVAVTPGQQDRVFRLQRGEGRGQSLDLKIGNDEKGRLDVEARTAGAGQKETVNVVEARRYLGFNAPSNSSSLTAAMAGNDEWVSAMHPSARLANEAQQSSTGQVVNTLKLEMNPANLGNVTAMLRLSGDELNVHLTVHTAAAYRELKDDSSSMLGALRAQGFSVDQVTVSMASSSSGSQDSSADAGGQFSQQQQNMQQASGEGGRNGGGQGNGQQDTRQSLSDSASTAVAGRGNEIDPNLSGARGTGRGRPDHVFL